MSCVKIDFQKTVGKVKPMHAVNNGPVYRRGASQRVTNIDAFIEAGIPYARNHDASFCASYGGEHTVDVHAIFRDFDRDPYDPASYDFLSTDEYVRVCEEAGVRTFYRLGTKIEHGVKKLGSIPPKDFHKWAVICEHIIRHYTEGWADGFKYDMEYWEIWNEPDLDAGATEDMSCWGGPVEDFFVFYCIAHKHLKACFPHLKIGGPASAYIADDDWRNRFLTAVKEAGIKPDFFSWHRYGDDVEYFRGKVRVARALLDRYGFTETESILDEWNYARGWNGEEYKYSVRVKKGLKGSAFNASVMAMSQYEPVDMIMYYDARPCAWNGMFSTDLVCDRLKGYYPFLMFGTLYRLGTAVEVASDDVSVYSCAATNGKEAAVMLSHFSDNDEKEGIDVCIDLSSFGSEDGCEVEYYLLDETHDLTLVGKSTYYGNRFEATLKMPLFTSYLIKIRKK